MAKQTVTVTRITRQEETIVRQQPQQIQRQRQPQRKMSISETKDMLYKAIRIQSDALKRGDMQGAAAVQDAALNAFMNNSVADGVLDMQSAAVQEALEAMQEGMQDDPDALQQFQETFGVIG